jgi:CHAT domain-containing protein/tetratricopeptide (TPR) repeat protein
VTSTSRADDFAGALMTADGARSEIWERSREVGANELAWALKRQCDAAWTADPPATLVAADLLEQLAAREPGAEVDALAAWTRGIALLSQGQMEAALVALERAGDSFGALGRPHDMAQTRISRLMALAMLGRYDDAVRCGAEARAVFDVSGDSRAAGKIELNLGNLAARRDHHDDAVRHYGEARARFAAAGDVELEVMAIKGLADMLARRHEFEPAEDLYRQAQDSAERGGFAVLTALIEGDLGAIALRRGRYDLALRLLERSRAQFARLEVPHRLAVAEESLADAYLELNLLPEALALYERSLATYEAAGLVTDRAWALSQRGRALGLLGRHAAAAASLAQAEQAFADEDNKTGAALVQLWLAELALRRRDWPAASRHATAAEAPLLAARQMSGYLHARGLFAEALRGGGDAVEAERVARATCASADALTLPQAQRRSRALLGLLARDRGDVGEARRCFESAVESIESQRGTLPAEEFRAAFLGDNLLPYQELVRLSLDEAGPRAGEQVLRWVERARARSLADSTAGARGSDDGSADPAQQELARLRLRLDDCYRALSRAAADGDDATRLLDDARRIEATLLEAGRRSALGGAARDRPDDGGAADFDLPALHDALADHSALVEYFCVDDALLACVVDGNGIEVVRLPVRFDDVQSSIEQLRFQTDTLRHGAARLAHRLPELRRRALHHLQRLHAGLWAPLAARLGARRVVVVPHGALHYLPFEALHDGHLHEVERRELCRVPSAAVLLRCLARPRPRFDSALVLGHADERLPHVRAEVDGVAARFPGARALHGGEACRDALHAGSEVDVLHIACHAQFRNDSPRFSALHLADGAFTVRDAARLRLRSRLVTLSACETGISAVMPGDELIGLTHGFISAGAASVLASLWTVQDETAARFMQRFYDRLRADGQPAQALRATQIDTLRDHPHPYFWSAFTLHGRW